MCQSFLSICPNNSVKKTSMAKDSEVKVKSLVSARRKEVAADKVVILIFIHLTENYPICVSFLYSRCW